MTTEFKVGDVIRVTRKGVGMVLVEGEEHTVLEVVGDGVCIGHTHDPFSPNRFELVRRASESPREGGFAVGSKWRIVGSSRESRIPYELIGKVATIVSGVDPDNDGRVSTEVDYPGDRWYIHPKDLEPADPAPAQPDCASHGHDWNVNRDCCVLCGFTAEQAVARGTPPQPAPMTRAARVLQGMERDPYLQSHIDCFGVPRSGKRAALESGNPKDGQTRLLTDGHPRNEAARLRMARISLDDELTYDQTRWRKLVLAQVPVGRR